MNTGPTLAPPWPELPAPRLGPQFKLAIAASVGVHLLALAWQHDLLPRLNDTPPTLNVVLRAPAPVALPTPVPQPVARVEPVEAPAPRIARPAKAEPIPAPRPAPVIARAASPEVPAIRTEAPRPAPVVTPAVSAPAPVAAEAAPPRAAAPVVAHAEPTPAAAVHVAPAADEPVDPALLERYGRNLSSLFARQQNYPRLAALRGWEGEVQVRITIARKGTIVATQVVRSSGFEVLDQNAVQLVTAAGPLPRPPENLQNREFQVIVPVHYKLEKSS